MNAAELIRDFEINAGATDCVKFFKSQAMGRNMFTCFFRTPHFAKNAEDKESR